VSGLFAPAVHGGPFTILTVCSGNLCRSAIAEQLLRARLNGQDFRIISAGSVANPGQPMPEEAAEMSRRYGGAPDGHRAAPLTAAVVEQAQLVLGAAREHRAAAVSLLPRASRHAFTLTEFARLSRALLQDDELGGPDRVAGMTPAERVRAIAAFRGSVRPDAPDADDIEDPYRRPLAVYERSAEQVDAAVSDVVAVLSAGQREAHHG